MWLLFLFNRLWIAKSLVIDYQQVEILSLEYTFRCHGTVLWWESFEAGQDRKIIKQLVCFSLASFSLGVSLVL
jgi:hypothetical protein